MTTRTGRACGKAILMGEHFVLHGSRAVAVPVPGRHVSVQLHDTASSDAPRGGYTGPPEGREVALAMRDALGLGEVALELGGDLPLAAGLGSSAALAVALVRAAGISPEGAALAAAHQLEQIAHGRASGIDDAVIGRERPVLFDRRLPEGARIQPLDVPMPPFWIAWVPRTGSTRDTVAAVASRAAADPEWMAACAASVDALVDRAVEALSAGDVAGLGRLLDTAQLALEDIAVVVDAHREMCDIARRHGALGAKTTGAGSGGAVMMLGGPELELDRVLEVHGYPGCFLAVGRPG